MFWEFRTILFIIIINTILIDFTTRFIIDIILSMITNLTSLCNWTTIDWNACFLNNTIIRDTTMWIKRFSWLYTLSEKGFLTSFDATEDDTLIDGLLVSTRWLDDGSTIANGVLLRFSEIKIHRTKCVQYMAYQWYSTWDLRRLRWIHICLSDLEKVMSVSQNM